MESSAFAQLNLDQQAALFREVAKVYLNNPESDDGLGVEVRRTLVGAFASGLKGRSRPLVFGRTVYLGSRRLDLTLKPRMLKLFMVFIECGTRFVSRDELVERVYGVQVSQLSDRYLASLRSNIVKLVSRARLLATEALGDYGEVHEWFVHDHRLRSWACYRTGPNILSIETQRAL